MELRVSPYSRYEATSWTRISTESAMKKPGFTYSVQQSRQNPFSSPFFYHYILKTARQANWNGRQRDRRTLVAEKKVSPSYGSVYRLLSVSKLVVFTSAMDGKEEKLQLAGGLLSTYFNSRYEPASQNSAYAHSSHGCRYSLLTFFFRDTKIARERILKKYA